jgi:hypothetical protein
MKSKPNSFFRILPALAAVGLTPVFAAVVDTTGSTLGAPITFAAGNTYTGDGFLTASGAPDTVIETTGGNVYCRASSFVEKRSFP